jgi:prefoldin alpha subunit
MSAGGGEMEELQQQLQAIEQQVEALEAEIEGLRVEQTEIDEAIEAVGEIETGDTVQVPLGGGAYVRAEIEDAEEIVVGFGGGYAGERDGDGAIETLERKRDLLDDRIEDIEGDIEELQQESAQLEQRAQQMQQQQMQQMQQQMGGQGPGGDQDGN